MNEDSFESLLKLVSSYITKNDTKLRLAITPREKLAVNYLATGRSFTCLKYSSFLSTPTISEAVISTCIALSHVLKKYIKMPTTDAEWIEIANEFGKLYNFPRCIGSLDGKHIEIIKPRMSGPSYYNYKGFYSIVLMALVNARKEFIMIDVGTNGKISDGGVLFYTKLWELYEQRKLNLPEPCPLPNTTTNFPYVFVADEAFALDTNLMHTKVVMPKRKFLICAYLLHDKWLNVHLV
ncbi:uncharacterized protein LOC143913039 [Arctopsyche grandis]|uniref:uncharacterized protein LOC143913039 n=1 Tax=Arctopsyche grandis TaxID=121162 RepID=UPI00406D8FD0